MKRFLMFSVSVLCLAITALIGFYIGSHQVEAQAPPEVQYFVTNGGGSASYITAILPNGDVYYNNHIGGPFTRDPSFYVGNFWEGAVSTDKSSWGDIKGQFEK